MESYRTLMKYYKLKLNEPFRIKGYDYLGTLMFVKHDRVKLVCDGDEFCSEDTLRRIISCLCNTIIKGG